MTPPTVNGGGGGGPYSDPPLTMKWGSRAVTSRLVRLLRSRRRSVLFLSIEFYKSIRLSDAAHGIVTKTVHKTLPGGGGWWGSGVVGVRGG